jgi:hypothetical protein
MPCCSKRRHERIQDGALPESELFNRLVTSERRLDEMLARYRRELEDASRPQLNRVCLLTPRGCLCEVLR